MFFRRSCGQLVELLSVSAGLCPTFVDEAVAVRETEWRMAVHLSECELVAGLTLIVWL